MSSSHSSPANFALGLRAALPFTSSSGDSADLGDAHSNLQRRQDGCSYSKARRSRCFIDQDSDGKPVKKCETTEQLLRHCVGKPQEILESKTEYTEEDAPSGWALDSMEDKERVLGQFPSDTPSFQPGPSETPSFPRRMDRGMDPFSKGLADGFESFVLAAEEMMNDFFNQLGLDSHEEGSNAESHRSFRRFPSERFGRKESGGGSTDTSSSRPQNSNPSKDPDFKTFSKDFEEV